jgi:hypothetical protein
MTDDFTALTEADHWLDWLGDNPAQAVRDEIARMLRQQVPTAALEWVRLLDKPYFLTGGRKQFNDPNKLIVKRAALAVPFELQVRSEGGVEQLRGVFSWVATGLNAERNDCAYLDLGVEMEWASMMLKARIYELDTPSQQQTTARGRWWEFWRKKP